MSSAEIAMQAKQSRSQSRPIPDAPQESVLDTPSRESLMNKEQNVTNEVGQVITTTTNNNATTTKENGMQMTEDTKRIKYSSLKSETNPLTIAREKAIKEGRSLMVNFDERVVVHTVPYWDPCGDTFYDTDDEDGPRGPNCCILL